MAKKQASTPGAPAASRGSNGRQVMGSAPMRVDDVSATDVKKGSLRPKKGPTADDAMMGVNSHRGRSATNASAQFRISVSHKAPQPQTASGTLASGRVVPAVMGSKQAFFGGMAG